VPNSAHAGTLAENTYRKQSVVAIRVVYEVHMAEKTARLVERLAPYSEENRNGNPYPSNQAMRNVALETMRKQLESTGGEHAKALEGALEGLIRADAFLPRSTEIVSALDLLAAARSLSDPTPLSDVAQAVVTFYPESRADLENELSGKGKAHLCLSIG
jgi:hypothetical protein